MPCVWAILPKFMRVRGMFLEFHEFLRSWGLISYSIRSLASEKRAVLLVGEGEMVLDDAAAASGEGETTASLARADILESPLMSSANGFFFASASEGRMGISFQS